MPTWLRPSPSPTSNLVGRPRSTASPGFCPSPDQVAGRRTENSLLVKDVRPWGAELTDIRISNGVISELAPHGRGDTPRLHAEDGELVVQGRGRLVIPTFSDAHCHLDSTRLGLPFRPHTGSRGIWPMVMNDREHWRQAEWSVSERATFTLARMIERGATRVRTYAQVDADCGLERLEGVLAARDAHAGRCEVEVIAFPQAGFLLEPGVPQLIDEALNAGATVVGGIDPCLLDRDPVRHLDILFGLAEQHRVPVDLHLHEPGALGVFTVDLVLERIRALDMAGLVTISHGYELGGVDDATTRRLIAEFAALDVSMTTVAPAQHASLPLAQLTAAGIRVGLGQDGQRDYWSPYGNGDMLERTWQLAFTNQYRADHLIEHCVAVAARGGASILNRDVPRLSGVHDRPGVQVGDEGSLLLMPGDCVTSAVMDRPEERTVIFRGRVVADALSLTA